jgi:hypothetical protein
VLTNVHNSWIKGTQGTSLAKMCGKVFYLKIFFSRTESVVLEGLMVAFTL